MLPALPSIGIVASKVPIVGKVLSVIPNFIGDLSGLLGVEPRGEYQKFTRIILPVLKAWASENGYPTYCFWFGEVIQVTEYGQWSVVLPVGGKGGGPGVSIGEAEAYWNSQPWLSSFAVMRCSGVLLAGATLQTIESGCKFDVYGPSGVFGGGGDGNPLPTPSGAGLGGWAAVLGLAALGVYYFTSKKR